MPPAKAPSLASALADAMCPAGTTAAGEAIEESAYGRWLTRQDAWVGELGTKSGVRVVLLEFAPRSPILRTWDLDDTGARVMLLLAENPTVTPAVVDASAPSFVLANGNVVPGPRWAEVTAHLGDTLTHPSEWVRYLVGEEVLRELRYPGTVLPRGHAPVASLVFAPDNFDFRPLRLVRITLNGRVVEVPGQFIQARDLRARLTSAMGGKAPPKPEETTRRPPLLPDAQVRRDPKSGLEFIHLRGGTFHYGCEPGDSQCAPDEKPGRAVTVKPFWMGRTEVTAGAYAACVRAGACSNDVTTTTDYEMTVEKWRERSRWCNYGVAEVENYPMNCVDWNQAQAFCHWIGGRLPSAEEWEYAAKGGGHRTYPWGNSPFTGPQANFCNLACIARFQFAENPTGKVPSAAGAQNDGWAQPAPVGSFPAGATKDGLLDMAGNVNELTGSDYNSYEKEERGGWYDGEPYVLRASWRGQISPRFRSIVVGFRCAM